ncbi:MAG: hypothetical protein A2821_01755 [Candidatus Magasanikbacteria bacterium RIFCSPHIGHO2_01_FULL_41_23]|uniref:Ribose-5-phosphate isomerase n=1 Tax=Candidatus Magasanikbacteria bacterium RIFCSPLOWO2_01_FULL_40_15 TaxID=1798686 RepID=A0A1F6N353_9BACT|nr:MAG: hypothetical protein A2821_01755 [Candidatus Magasanikbacteria bacterium RIFCSPHIGHO2_01_FULL_41_23]OGH75048.1 MAG: hypothetical protein A3F22_00465 [Candidatus Magasanikbacteria bacterium RIFCSPHIGHO2_12_FULL_41_16]OGH78302.1 MAG: hypothetical protein A2983_04070 [Candidatus Magasanikbacteria bacterium RIFCSPLOWO2_01_FULL_40_15]
MYNGPLYITSDHGGFQLKKRLIRYLENELKRPVTDMGPDKHMDDDDYPDYVFPLANRVVAKNARGIAICKNGIGVTIAANKVRGARAGLCYNLAVAESMMLDDNTNIMCLASHLSTDEHAMAMVKRWLATDFSGAERHIRRLQKEADYEAKK